MLYVSLFFMGDKASSALHCFPNYSFLLLHPVNQDDRQLHAHVMASDFTVAWQFSQREQLFCFFVTDQTPHQFCKILFLNFFYEFK
jgi:hypothetical protein